jgi:hypothetical protein
MNCRCFLALWLPSIAAAQIQCIGAWELEHFTVPFRTVSDRGGPPEQSCGETTAEGDTIRRVLYDTSGKPYFGYEIRITAVGAKQYRAEMRPLENSRLLSFPKFPQPAVVRADEIIDVLVLEKSEPSVRRTGYLESWLTRLGLVAAHPPKTSGRLTDYLQIVPKGAPWSGIPFFRGWAATPPAGTILTLDQPHLSNILGDVGRNREMGVIGPVVWLYREGLGRFLFSASARPGFRKAALAEGALLRFSDEPRGPTMDSEYTVGLHSNALPMAGAWMIWMKHEPDFRQPPGPWTKEELKKGLLAIGVER